jgi:hypothetical protein
VQPFADRHGDRPGLAGAVSFVGLSFPDGYLGTEAARRTRTDHGAGPQVDMPVRLMLMTTAQVRARFQPGGPRLRSRWTRWIATMSATTAAISASFGAKRRSRQVVGECGGRA